MTHEQLMNELDKAIKLMEKISKDLRETTQLVKERL